MQRSSGISSVDETVLRVSDQLFPLEPVPPVKRRRNAVWDALEEVFGPATTRSNEKLRGMVSASLDDAGATPDEIYRRARSWPLHFPGAVLTETAFEKHWDRPGRPPLRGSVTPREIQRAERRLRIVGGE
jgi:hypothetical protein